MARQLQWENVEIGTEIPPQAKMATTQTLVKWAGASGDFIPIHYDEAFAKSQGLPGVIIHGALKRQWLVQLVTDWIGEEGTLKKFSCQYKAMDQPRHMKSLTEPEEGETWWCKGKVAKKYADDSGHYLDCEVWVENGAGEVTTSGKATVSLPSQAATP